MPEEAEPPPQKLTFKPAEFESVNPPKGMETPSGNDPLELLRRNREHEKANNWIYDQSPPVAKRKSLRNRHFILLFLGVNGIMGGIYYATPDEVAHVFLIAGMLMFSSGLTWSMFVVHDDY